jgi:alpha-ketoglutarate-dependent taurine dioxygenase
VQEILEKEMGFYAHKWEKGDMLIWDNLQVMHKSSGNFKGRRLLFRTQGRNNE